VANQSEYFILLVLFGYFSLQIKNPDQDLSDLIDDCERFILRSFDAVKQSAMHIYHSALSWTPTSSPTRQLYECEFMTETQLVNAVSRTWDACIRIIPVTVGEKVKAIVFSPSGALIAAHGGCCVEVFNAFTGVNRATFDGDMSICSVAFSPDDGFLVAGLSGGTISVWNVQTGTMFQTFKWDMWSATYSVAFSPCGTMIASGNTDWTVQIWNIVSGGWECVFKGHSGTVMGVCWLPMWNQIVSASNDLTVRIWDVQKQTCLKIFAHYHDRVTDLAFSQGLLLVASKNGTANIYDPQSGDIIHVIRSNNITHSHFSIDGGKVLVASRNSGDIWDITTSTLIHVGSIKYNGEQATFSPDGTRLASIYGKFMKIWETGTRYNHHEASTHVHNTIDNIHISPDEQLVTLKSEKGANILDATTGQSLFTYPVADFLSIGFSQDLALVAFLVPLREVQIWNAHTHLHKSITIDYDVFHIALSPDGSQLASLSQFDMKLWDLKSKECLAHLEFDSPSGVQVQISFSTNATSITLSKNSGGTRNWLISPNHNIDLSRDSIKNSGCTQQDPAKLPILFVPTTEDWSNQDVSAPCQSYHCDTDDEWILDQDGRHILWIPPDERPRKIWNGFKCEKKVLIQTESGKVYYVNFLQS
jgi:WD40 repeat protein